MNWRREPSEMPVCKQTVKKQYSIVSRVNTMNEEHSHIVLVSTWADGHEVVSPLQVAAKVNFSLAEYFLILSCFPHWPDVSTALLQSDHSPRSHSTCLHLPKKKCTRDMSNMESTFNLQGNKMTLLLQCILRIKAIGLLKRIKSSLPHNTRILVFNSFISPLFDYDYGDIIWWDRGNVSLMSLHKIEK